MYTMLYMKALNTLIAKIGAGVLVVIAIIVVFFLGYEQYEKSQCLEWQADGVSVSYEQYFSCAQYEIFLPVGESI
jgi:predicted negative regulator of RcsB-dependent stress response